MNTINSYIVIEKVANGYIIYENTPDNEGRSPRAKAVAHTDEEVVIFVKECLTSLEYWS